MQQFKKELNTFISYASIIITLLAIQKHALHSFICLTEILQ